jgi:hypothetical protein
MSRKLSNVRKWAFWGAVIGFVAAGNNFLHTDVNSCPILRWTGQVVCIREWIELVGGTALVAGLGALAAWARNRYIV